MPLTKTITTPSSRRPGLYPKNAIFASLSPENVLLVVTMLLFGYCFLYVSLPFMLRKHADRLAVTAAQRSSVALEHLAQAK